jgi:hypothetical protein
MAAITLRKPRNPQARDDEQQDGELFGAGARLTHDREFTVKPGAPRDMAGRQMRRIQL